MHSSEEGRVNCKRLEKNDRIDGTCTGSLAERLNTLNAIA
jgi:hypothetical protein